MARQFVPVAGPFGGLIDALVWDGQGLLFSAIAEDSLMRFDPSSGTLRVFRPYWTRVRGLAFAPDGTLYGAQAGSRRIVRFNADGSASPVRALLDGQMHNCPEDLTIDRAGRIWFSDPYDTVVPRGPDIKPLLDHASVLRLERDGSLRRMTFDTRYPRGVLLAPDERTLYVTDSPADGPAEVRAYPVQDDGTLGTFRCLYRWDSARADGLCLDSEGNIVVCAGELCLLSPDGQLLDSSAVPSGSPADCAFAERDLYVSTTDGYLLKAVS